MRCYINRIFYHRLPRECLSVRNSPLARRIPALGCSEDAGSFFQNAAARTCSSHIHPITGRRSLYEIEALSTLFDIIVAC